MSQNQNQNQNNNNQLKYHLVNSSSSYDTQLIKFKNIIYDPNKLVKNKFQPLKDFINAIFPNNSMKNKYNNMKNLLDTDTFFYTIFQKSVYSYQKSISLENLENIVEILEKSTTKTRYTQIYNSVYKKNNNTAQQELQQNVNNTQSTINMKELYKITPKQYSLLLDIFLDRKVLTYNSDYHDILILAKKFKYTNKSFKF